MSVSLKASHLLKTCWKKTMFEPGDPKLWGVPPGVDFSKSLIAGLEARLANAPPDAWARVTIYVNTRRMQRRLVQLFSDGPPRLLPCILTVTDLAALPGAISVPNAKSRLQVRLELAQIVGQLIQARPDIAPANAVFDLATSLSDLMDEMAAEGVNPDALQNLDVGDHAAHWQQNLSVLNIIRDYMSGDSDTVPGSNTRLRLVVEAISDQWAKAPIADPVIVAGSTGSRGATRILMKAVAALPQGAVIVPGFDFHQPKAVWNSLSDVLTAEDHPQFRFQTLLDDLSLEPENVAPWCTSKPANTSRNALISLALRPAPVTDQWRTEGHALADQIPVATNDLTLILAPTPRKEAEAIAICLRRAVEEGKTAALISPDRMLTRQVSAALDRWRLVPDDSAGQPLNLSAPGRFFRHLLALPGNPVTLTALLTLLKHPLTASSELIRGDHLRWTRELELFLRDRAAAFPSAGHLSEWLGKSSSDDGRKKWVEWVTSALLMPDPPDTGTLADHITKLIARAELIAAGADQSDSGALWEEAAGEEAKSLFDTLIDASDHGGILSFSDFGMLLETVLSEGQVRVSTLPHPQIMIWGTMEARVQGADLVILGGLNDGIWPSSPSPDPWLNRQMRKEVGLLLPERRIGLAAHDFQQAVAAKTVVLTRSIRADDAETVPSRWLNRLGNLLRGLGEVGPASYEQMLERGNAILRTADALHTVAPVQPASRPSPRPPIELRPNKLSVTAITRLIRDPYAIYASRVLKLRPLAALNPDPDARLKGMVLHDVMAHVIRPGQTLPANAIEAFSDAIDTVLAEQVPWPAIAELWRARFLANLSNLIDRETARAARGIPMLSEERHAYHLNALDFTLTAQPDRIDRLNDGGFAIYDYKSGVPPTESEVRAFDKQLPLEAAMLERGAFASISGGTVTEMTYIGLGSTGLDRVIPQHSRKFPTELLSETWEGLHQLIGRYLTDDQGYTSRRANQKQVWEGDYDHLARFGEWSDVDDAVSEDVDP
jgi:ATP-dependent helicase/nuclease subunit B